MRNRITTSPHNLDVYENEADALLSFEKTCPKSERVQALFVKSRSGD